jgi:hypothetical protein
MGTLMRLVLSFSKQAVKFENGFSNQVKSLHLGGIFFVFSFREWAVAHRTYVAARPFRLSNTRHLRSDSDWSTLRPFNKSEYNFLFIWSALGESIKDLPR